MPDTVSELRAVLAVTGADQAARDMDKAGASAKRAAVEVAEFANALRTTTGVASGLKSLNEVMDGTANSMRRVGIDTGKMNQLVQQASFGMQDFAITIGQGGLGMALRSASNNVAQMGAIMGGAEGAALGLVVTLGSLIPDLFHMASGHSKAAKAAEKQAEALKKLKEAADETADVLSRLDEMLNKVARERKIKDDVADIEKEPEGLKKFAKADDAVAKAENELRDAGKQIAIARKERNEVRKDVGFGARAGEVDIINDIARTLRTKGKDAAIAQAERELKGTATLKKFGGGKGVIEDIERQNKGMLGGFGGAGLGKKEDAAFEVDEKLREEKRRRLEEVNKRVDDAQKKAAEAQERLDKLRPVRKAALDEAPGAEADKEAAERRKKLGKEADKFAKEQEKEREKQQRQAARDAAAHLKDIEKSQKDIGKFFKDYWKGVFDEVKRMGERAEKHRQRQLKGLEGEKKDVEAMLKAEDPIGFGLRKIQEKFQDAAGSEIGRALARNPFDIAGAGAAGLRAASAGGKAQKDFLDKAQPKLEGTFGVADFSRQLQNSLLKDDTNKMIQHNTEAVKKNTADAVKRLDEINKGIANLKSAKGVFAP